MNIKKMLAGICALTLIGGVLPSVVPMKYTNVVALEEGTSEWIGDLMYEIEDGRAVVTACKLAFNGEMVIPAEIEGYPVTEIGDSAFFRPASITSVVIPNSITRIGEKVFTDCKKLTSITIPSSVTSIGGYAFGWCEKLTSITILNKDCELGEHFLYNTSTYDANGFTKYFTGTIYGYAGSTAQAYAEESGFKFVALEDVPPETTTPAITITTTTTTASTTIAPPVQTIVLGDPTGDGTIDSSDASAVLAEYAAISTGGKSTLTAEQLAAADVNKDGKIDAADASIMLEFYAYISTGGTETDMYNWLKTIRN